MAAAAAAGAAAAAAVGGTPPHPVPAHANGTPWCDAATTARPAVARALLLPRDALVEHEARPRAGAHVAEAAAAAAALAAPAVRAAAGANIVVPPAAVANGLWCCAEIGKAACVESNFWTPDSHAAANRPAPAVTPALRGRAARRALTGIAILAVLMELANPDATAVDPLVARVSASLAKLLATNRPGEETPPPKGFVGERVPLGVDGLLQPSLLRALRGGLSIGIGFA